MSFAHMHNSLPAITPTNYPRKPNFEPCFIVLLKMTDLGQPIG